MKKPEEILKEARELKRLTQSEVADKIGIGLRMYQKIEGGQFPKYKRSQLKEIDSLLDTNLYELIYDQSDPSLEESSGNYIEHRRKLKTDTSPYLVPFIDVDAQAGYRKAYSDIDYIHTLKHYPILPDVDPTGATWRYFQVAGDSMEPVLNDGDTVLTSLVMQDDWDNIRDYYTHVVVTHTELLIKDIFKNNDNEWILLSQNPHYEPRLLKIEDVRQLFVVRRRVQNKLPKNRQYNISDIKKQLKNKFP